MSMFPLLDSAASGMETQQAALERAARDAAFAQGGDAGVGDVLHEMISVMRASRNYESDTALFETGKRIAQQTIDLERT